VKTRTPAIAIALCLSAAGAPLRADWKDSIGFTRLQMLAGGDLPATLPQGFSQIEALEPETSGYVPDTASPLFTGRVFALKSGASAVSNHAQRVATNFYGNTQLFPGTAAMPVDLYSADNWLNLGFLKIGTSNVPAIESRAVQNHSWIVDTTWTASRVEEANQRLDFAIDRDGFVCVAGENNGSSTTLPQFLGQSYHTISVGRGDGSHSAGFTAYDGSGRIKPEIVAPNASPDFFTSYTTPMVAGSAGLLVGKLSAAPYSLGGADRPRVAKALLLASATQDTVASWANTSSRPLDLRYGAGMLNLHHAYQTLVAGRADSGSISGIRAWAAETVAASSSSTWYFTIPAGAPATPFNAALTWHRNVSSTLSGNGPFNKTLTWSAALADLNLRLLHASGGVPGAIVAESLSGVDNVEFIHQSALPPGEYALRVENLSGTATPCALAWHSLPAVTVIATGPIARETDGQPALVTITRTGNLSLPLHVPFAIGGNAIAGIHYQTLPASIVIPVGESSATIQIVPVSDSLAQGDRSLTIGVAADFALVRDPSQAALVIIQDKPFDAWRFAAFTAPELADPSISGESADPDGDRLANLIEFALGLDPMSADTSPVAMTDADGYLALSVPKNPAATDLIWSAEVGDDLQTWTPAFVLADTESTFEARDNVLKSAAEKRLIRLKITRP
jgi:hypothetical protein